MRNRNGGVREMETGTGPYPVKPALGVPYTLGQLSVLQQRVRPRRVVGAHAHIHAAKGEGPAEPLRREIPRGAAVDGLERVQVQKEGQEARPQHREERAEVLAEDVDDADLIVPMGLLQKAEIALKSVLALPLLDLELHPREIGRQLNRLAVGEPDLVVGLAFQEFHAFGLETRSEVVEGFGEESGQQ